MINNFRPVGMNMAGKFENNLIAQNSVKTEDWETENSKGTRYFFTPPLNLGWRINQKINKAEIITSKDNKGYDIINVYNNANMVFSSIISKDNKILLNDTGGDRKTFKAVMQEVIDNIKAVDNRKNNIIEHLMRAINSDKIVRNDKGKQWAVRRVFIPNKPEDKDNFVKYDIISTDGKIRSAKLFRQNSGTTLEIDTNDKERSYVLKIKNGNGKPSFNEKPYIYYLSENPEIMPRKEEINENGKELDDIRSILHVMLEIETNPLYLKDISDLINASY